MSGMRPVVLPLLALVALGFARAAPAQTVREPACPAPEARQFDFWIGSWDVSNSNRKPAAPDDTTHYPTGPATDLVHSVLDGCAIVEHWNGYLSFGHVLGFSVRAWDPGKGKWVLVLDWPAARGASFGVLEGTFQNGVGSFYNDVTTPDGRSFRVRYRFSKITPTSLQWDGARSTDGGQTWEAPFWIMRFTRRDPVTDRALLGVASRTVAKRCADPRARAFDFLVGDWAGKETPADGGEARDVEVHAWSILEGCAVMDEVTTGAGGAETKRFRVRSYLPGEERWVEYSLDRGRPGFVRWEGPADGTADRVLTSADGAPATRVSWTPDGPDAYARETAVSTDGGATWTPVSRAELHRR